MRFFNITLKQNTAVKRGLAWLLASGNCLANLTGSFDLTNICINDLLDQLGKGLVGFQCLMNQIGEVFVNA